MWIEFAREVLSAVIPLFPFPQKPISPNSNFTRNQVDEEPLCGCATSKSLFVYVIEVFFYLTFRGPAFSVVANLFWFQYSDTVLYTQLLYFSRLFDYDHAVKNAKQVSMSEKRYLPTVLESNNFTIKYLLLSKAVLKKLNCIKICLYQKLNRLRRTRTLYKLRK